MGIIQKSNNLNAFLLYEIWMLKDHSTKMKTSQNANCSPYPHFPSATQERLRTCTIEYPAATEVKPNILFTKLIWKTENKS